MRVLSAFMRPTEALSLSVRRSTRNVTSNACVNAGIAMSGRDYRLAQRSTLPGTFHWAMRTGGRVLVTVQYVATAKPLWRAFLVPRSIHLGRASTLSRARCSRLRLPRLPRRDAAVDTVNNQRRGPQDIRVQRSCQSGQQRTAIMQAAWPYTRQSPDARNRGEDEPGDWDEKKYLGEGARDKCPREPRRVPAIELSLVCAKCSNWRYLKRPG